MFRFILMAALACAASIAVSATVYARQEAKKMRFEIPEKDIPEPGENGKATVINDGANLLSLELRGSWTMHLDVYGHMNPDKRGFGRKFEATFKESPEQAKRILAKLDEYMPALKDDYRGNRFASDFREAMRHIYQAGELVAVEGEETMTMAYALISWRGNPHLLLLEGENNFESSHVMLARDPNGDHDILFIGGDQAKEAFVPMKRKK